MIDFSKMDDFTSDFMLSQVEAMKGLIYNDARKGIMQNGKSGFQYRSVDYANLKADGAYGRQASRNVDYVDMTLTGDLWNRIAFKSEENLAELNFDENDTNKILHNLKYNRVINDLSDENLETITDNFIVKLADNIEQLNGIEEIIVSLNI